jgi:hypothetical protein
MPNTHEDFVKGLESPNEKYGKPIKQTLNEQSELYYYIQKLNQELKKKDPENYEKLTKEYGYDPNHPLSSKTRIAGAEYYVNKSGGRDFDKSLSVGEQKKILGEDYDQYVNLKKTYGADLKLFGTNEDPNKPETWKVGARHAVALNPVTWQSTNKNETTGKIESDYLRAVNYDPTKADPYINSDTNLLEQNKKPQQYTRTLSKVVYEPNTGKTTNSEGKVVWTGNQPLNYYAVYDDGSKRPIHQSEYQKWIGFNKAPADVKQKYGTETVSLDDLSPSEREVAKTRMDSSNNNQ